MSDLPRPEADIQVDVPSSVLLGAGMRITKEQLAAAERTRAYHLRKLQERMARQNRASEATGRSEH